MSDNLLHVSEGNIIYKDDVVHQLAIIVDKKENVLLKWGDNNNGYISKYYYIMSMQIHDLGYTQMVNDLTLIEFDKLSNMLSLEDICILMNPAIECSGGVGKILDIVNNVHRGDIEKTKWIQEEIISPLKQQSNIRR